MEVVGLSVCLLAKIFIDQFGDIFKNVLNRTNLVNHIKDRVFMPGGLVPSIKENR